MSGCIRCNTVYTFSVLNSCSNLLFISSLLSDSSLRNFQDVVHIIIRLNFSSSSCHWPSSSRNPTMVFFFFLWLALWWKNCASVTFCKLLTSFTLPWINFLPQLLYTAFFPQLLPCHLYNSLSCSRFSFKLFFPLPKASPLQVCSQPIQVLHFIQEEGKEWNERNIFEIFFLVLYFGVLIKGSFSCFEVKERMTDISRREDTLVITLYFLKTSNFHFLQNWEKFGGIGKRFNEIFTKIPKITLYIQSYI